MHQRPLYRASMAGHSRWRCTTIAIVISATNKASCRSPNSVKAILAGRDDFSRHNPIHRWWGGTELTNDRLWRWDPECTIGLGATEMRMLELISEGNGAPPDVFPGHEKRNERRVFDYWEIGALLDGLAHCPGPAVSGLDEGPFTLEMHDDRDRHQRYKQSKLPLTELGKAIMAGRDDFSRHNPVHRWWAGTELTNDRLWRWDPEKQVLVAPR